MCTIYISHTSTYSVRWNRCLLLDATELLSSVMKCHSMLPFRNCNKTNMVMVFLRQKNLRLRFFSCRRSFFSIFHSSWWCFTKISPWMLLCLRNLQLLPSFYFITVLLVTESGHTEASNDSNVKSGWKGFCLFLKMTYIVYVLKK